VTTLRFTKLHGAGNDFLLLDGIDAPPPEAPERLAPAMCDRRAGVGADGLVLLVRSEVADARFVLFNADGSRAETSGNGLRCAAKFLADRGRVTGEIVRLETDAGIREVRVRRRGGAVVEATADMGAPELLEEGIEIHAEGRSFRADVIALGNPHVVVFLEEPLESFPVERFGPALERHPRFPNRMNVHFARLLDGGAIEQRSWERGSGETLACGSGACASAVSAIRRARAASEVLVRTRGGDLRVAWDGRGAVRLTGPAVEVSRGEWPLRGGAGDRPTVQ